MFAARSFGRPVAARIVFARGRGFASAAKIEQFKADVAKHLPADGKGVAFASAWLATDNVFVALLKAHCPKVLDGMTLVAIDTLHVFPEALVTADAVQSKYGKKSFDKVATRRDNTRGI